MINAIARFMHLCQTMMSSRLDNIKCVVAAYHLVDKPLLCFTNMRALHKANLSLSGYSTIFAGRSDDLGIYAFTGFLAHYFNLAPMSAYDLLYIIILVISLLSCLFIIACSKNFIIGVLNTCVLFGIVIFLAQKYSIIYATAGLTIITILPMFMYFLRSNNNVQYFYLYMFIAGIVLGCAHYIRNFSAVPVLVMIFIGVLLHKNLMKKHKILLLVILGIGFFMVSIFFTRIIASRNDFAKSINSKFYATIEQRHISEGHPLWHSVFIGLGYTSNNFGLRYNDGVGFRAAQSVDKNVISYSREYDEILRNLTFTFIASHKLFFLKNLVVKFNTLLLDTSQPDKVLLRAALFHSEVIVNLVRLIFWFLLLLAIQIEVFYCKETVIKLAFFFGISTTMLPGLLVAPYLQYSVAFHVMIYFYIFDRIFWYLNQRVATKQ